MNEEIVRNKDLAGRLLDYACQELLREMQEFAFETSMDTVCLFKDDPKWGTRIQEYEPGMCDGSAQDTRQWFVDNLQMVQSEIQTDNDVLNDRLAEDRRLGDTAKGLIYELGTRLKTISQKRTPEALAQQAGLLHDFAEMLTIYQVAWEQRHKEEFWSSADIEKGFELRAIRAGGKVVSSLYKIVEDQALDLKYSHPHPKRRLLLVVVPFMSRLYAGGFDVPAPFIVSPRWGHQQAWTWLGYAHEVGHHVYRNVKGLGDELKVNVVTELWIQGYGKVYQRIWFNWLEEIFADLFGLLRLGLAFAQTQQIMLHYLPRQVVQRMEGGEGAGSRKVLPLAAEDTHPIPYLRTRLAIKALEMLGASDTGSLREYWDDFFKDVDTSKVYAHVWGREVELPTEEMNKARDIVLDTILNTELYALRKKSLKSVFYESLDEDNLRSALVAITTGTDTPDLRHLLAAIPQGLDLVRSEQLEIVDLNRGVIDAIIKYK